MTKRQQEIHAIVIERRTEILEIAEPELRERPFGFSAVVRLCLGFARGELHLIVTRLPEGWRYREYDPGFHHRKGRAEPRWRTLSKAV